MSEPVIPGHSVSSLAWISRQLRWNELYPTIIRNKRDKLLLWWSIDNKKDNQRRAFLKNDDLAPGFAMSSRDNTRYGLAMTRLNNLGPTTQRRTIVSTHVLAIPGPPIFPCSIETFSYLTHLVRANILVLACSKVKRDQRDAQIMTKARMQK